MTRKNILSLLLRFWRIVPIDVRFPVLGRPSSSGGLLLAYSGNRFLTLLSNMLTNLNLTDMESCYKVFRRELLDGLTLEKDRFGVEPELVAKIAQTGARIYELGISLLPAEPTLREKRLAGKAGSLPSMQS